MNALAEKYCAKIEGFIPDLNQDLSDDPDGLRDAVYDFACDHIYDREPHELGDQLDTIRQAAKEISEHFCGQEEAS